jgi:hypothetical protein
VHSGPAQANLEKDHRGGLRRRWRLWLRALLAPELTSDEDQMLGCWKSARKSAHHSAGFGAWFACGAPTYPSPTQASYPFSISIDRSKTPITSIVMTIELELASTSTSHALSSHCFTYSLISGTNRM